MALGEVLRGSIENNALEKFRKLPSPPEHWRFLSTSEFLAHINNLAVEVIKSPSYHDPESGYISQEAWKKLVDGGILSSSLGERNLDHRQEELMQIGRILSYYDLHLGLTYGITTALAIMPLQRFGSKEQKEKYLDKIRNGEMIGLGITELNKSGSAALDMDSNYINNGDGTVTLKFEKHLQGLSGKDGLIVAANKADAAKKTIGLFIVDKEVINTQLTKMAGLSGIPYGINTGEVTLDLKKHLMAELSNSNLRDFQDMFTKSRFLFVAMTLGHQERMEQEANNYAAERMIGPTSQADMSVPQRYLGKIKARRVATEAIFKRVTKYRTNGKSLLNGDTMDFVAEANIVKALSTEYALSSAFDRAELMGGNAYYAGSALQDYADIWPFLIFEGTRRMLNTQIGHSISRNPFNRHGHESEELFNRYRAGKNLDKQSLLRFAQMRLASMTRAREEVWGQIVSRFFALGCLDENDLEADKFEQTKAMLNLEIKQLALEFLSA